MTEGTTESQLFDAAQRIKKGRGAERIVRINNRSIKIIDHVNSNGSPCMGTDGAVYEAQFADRKPEQVYICLHCFHTGVHPVQG
jgi:hypothetical protein